MVPQYILVIIFSCFERFRTTSFNKITPICPCIVPKPIQSKNICIKLLFLNLLWVSSWVDGLISRRNSSCVEHSECSFKSLKRIVQLNDYVSIGPTLTISGNLNTRLFNSHGSSSILKRQTCKEPFTILFAFINHYLLGRFTRASYFWLLTFDI